MGLPYFKSFEELSLKILISCNNIQFSCQAVCIHWRGREAKKCFFFNELSAGEPLARWKLQLFTRLWKCRVPLRESTTSWFTLFVRSASFLTSQLLSVTFYLRCPPSIRQFSCTFEININKFFIGKHWGLFLTLIIFRLHQKKWKSRNLKGNDWTFKNSMNLTVQWS